MRKSLFNNIYDDFLKKENFTCVSFQENFPETIGVITLPQIRSRRNLLTSGIKRKNRVKTYSNNVSKRFLQFEMMDFFQVREAEVVALLGPSESYKDYVSMLNWYIQPKIINSWENDIKIFSNQKCDNDKIIFKFGDVSNCKPTNYMDIDLKCSYKSCKNMIISLFNKQVRLSGDKVFHFSYSVNWLDSQSVDDVIINSIRDLIGQKASLIDITSHCFTDKKISIREYFIGNCDKFILRAFWYYDSSPMVSISIFSSDKIIYETREEKINYVIHNLVGRTKKVIPLDYDSIELLSDSILDVHIARSVIAA